MASRQAEVRRPAAGSTPSAVPTTNTRPSLDDVEGFRQACLGNPLVARAAMFSIDYPHEITLFGRAQAILSELSTGLEPEVKHAILAGTAMRLYNLPDSPEASANVLAPGA